MLFVDTASKSATAGPTAANRPAGTGALASTLERVLGDRPT